MQPPTAFEIKLGDFTVSGSINRVTPEGLLFYRPATIKPKDLLRAWVEHLLWNAVRPDGAVAQTVIVGTKSIWKLAPVSDPLPVLDVLLGRYWSGLREPLRFFPESSYEFAAADYKAAIGKKGRTAKTPQDFAEETWNGSDYTEGEREDEYFAIFFRNDEALDDEFEANARAVFRPLLAVAEEIKE